MFAEDTSEDFSEDRRYHFSWIFIVFLDIFEIFAEDCFLLRSFRKFFTLWVFTLKPFPGQCYPLDGKGHISELQTHDRICTALFEWGHSAVVPNEGVQIWSCVCSYMAGHEDARAVTGHIGTNTQPNLHPLAGDDRALTILKWGCANSVGRGFGAR